MDQGHLHPSGSWMEVIHGLFFLPLACLPKDYTASALFWKRDDAVWCIFSSGNFKCHYIFTASSKLSSLCSMEAKSMGIEFYVYTASAWYFTLTCEQDLNRVDCFEHGIFTLWSSLFWFMLYFTLIPRPKDASVDEIVVDYPMFLLV